MTSPSRRGSKRVCLWLGLAVLLVAPHTAVVQDDSPDPAPLAPSQVDVDVAPTPVFPSAVLTLDQEALFANSAFGRRVQEDLERDRASLAQENRRIEAALVDEELELTQKRATMSPEAFTPLANAFNEKVEETRSVQDGKSLLLQQRLEQERQSFLSQAGPVIAAVVRQRGGAVVIDRNAILLAFEGVDITEEAVAAIDAAIGSGTSIQLTPPAPAQRPLPNDPPPVER